MITMRIEKLSIALSKIDKVVTQVFLVVGCAVLFMLMLLTAMDVGLRYLLNHPLPGAYELTQYMMAIIVPFALVACAYEKGHVGVDLVVTRLPKTAQLLLEVATRLIATIFLLIISWQNILEFIDVYHTHITSSVLLIPEYPFIIPVAISAAVFGLILFVYFLEALSEVSHK